MPIREDGTLDVVIKEFDNSVGVITFAFSVIGFIENYCIFINKLL